MGKEPWCAITEPHAHEFAVYHPDGKLAWSAWYIVTEGQSVTWEAPETPLQWVDHCHHPGRKEPPSGKITAPQ